MTKPVLHVGIDATSWDNNRGYGRFTRELVRALAARCSGFRYTLVFDQEPAVATPPGVGVLVAGEHQSLKTQSAGSASRTFGYLRRLGALASRANFDIFFFPTVYSYFPLLSKTPCIVCCHDMIAERFPDLVFPTRRNVWLWRVKTALAKLQARRVMTISQASADDIEAMLKIPRRKIDVITEGPSSAFRRLDDPARVEAARQRHGAPQGAPLLVYVGGFNRHKNVRALLTAMSQVLERHEDARLALVGDISGHAFWDNAKELIGEAACHPLLAERVQFTGYLDDVELTELLNGASALVLPSLAEGFGLPAVEAMACGAPVLASNRGSLPEVVGPAGLLFDPEDPSDIARAIIQFLDDPALQARLAAAAREQVRQFTWERAAELAEQSFRRCGV